MKLSGIRGDATRISKFELKDHSDIPGSSAESRARDTAVEGLQMLDFMEQLDGTRLDLDERPDRVRLENAPTGVGEGKISALWEKNEGKVRARAVLSDQGTDDFYNFDGKVIERATVHPDGSSDAQKVNINTGPASDRSGLAYHVSYLEGGQALMSDAPFTEGGLKAPLYNGSSDYGFPVELNVDSKEQTAMKALLSDRMGLDQDAVTFKGGYVETYASGAMGFRIGGLAAPRSGRSLVFEDAANEENYVIRTPDLSQPLSSLEGTLIGKWKVGQEPPSSIALLSDE